MEDFDQSLGFLSYKGKRFYLQTPEMTVKAIGEDKIFLGVDKLQDSSLGEFRKYVQCLDRICKVFCVEHSSIMDVLSNYRDSTVIDFVDDTWGMVLDISSAEFFDEDKISLPRGMLKKGSRCRALILSAGANSGGIRWSLKQLQIYNSGNVFDDCVLSDSEVDEEV